jgi:peroxiredoxin
MDGIQDAAQMASLTGARFPVLADPQGNVVRRYGVYNLHEDQVAAPATLVIGQEDAVLWRHVGRNIADRPTVEEILAVLEDME